MSSSSLRGREACRCCGLRGSAEEVKLKDDVYDFELAHRFLKDGRLIEIDPDTGKWNRRPQGIAKELWDNTPSARPYPRLLRDSETEVEDTLLEPHESDGGYLPSVAAGSSTDGVIDGGTIGIPIDDDEGLAPLIVLSYPKEIRGS